MCGRVGFAKSLCETTETNVRSRLSTGYGLRKTVSLEYILINIKVCLAIGRFTEVGLLNFIRNVVLFY